MLHGNSDASSVNAAYEAAKHKILEVRATWETTLNLDGIGLVSLPPDIGKCTYLENLSISNNLLTSLPSEIGECKLLRHLDLSNNKLTNLPSEIARCSNLRNVLLPGNRFTALPTPLTKCKNLEQIDLSGNEIETLSPLIGQCTSLKQLSVSGNLLVSLPAEIGSCKRLRFINLESNRLSDLPVELRQLDDLSSLRLHLNDALGLPREILGPYSTTARSAPPKSILDYYFSRLKQGSRPLNEVKLLLVGRGATGKTSVSRALRKLHYKEKLGETQGIEIQPWDILCGEDRIKVHLWDFAGQEITHETHRFFLTQRSVYLVVLDGRGGQQMEEAEYWLSHVEKYGGDESPVIVVLNKWKTDGPYEIEQRRLQREFPHIRAFIQTDCAAKHGLIDLEETLQSVVDSMKSVRQTWPATWDDVRRELEHMVTKEHCNFLKWDDYKKICADRRVTEPQEQESLAIVLHELGFALYYGNNEQLRDTRVLNPNWAANGLYGLVRGVQRRPRPGHPGEFFVNDLPEILQEGTKAMNPERGANFSDYEGQDVQQFLVDLMVDRELGFLAGQVRGRDLYLLPGLLTLDEPDPTTYDITAHIEMAVVRFRFVYDLLPSGVMSRFIVRTHPLSEDYYRWQRGVVLGWGEARCLVMAERRRNPRVETFIHGGTPPERQALAGIVRSNMESIHANLPSGLRGREELDLTIPGQWQEVAKLEKLEEEDRQLQVVTDSGTRELPVTPQLEQVQPKNRKLAPRLKLFVSYAHVNYKMWDRLKIHLDILKNERLIEWWYDGRIRPGVEWNEAIRRELSEADIILLLTSPAFFASKYISGIEMREAKAKLGRGEARVLPVLLEESEALKAHKWLAQIQAVPVTQGRLRPVSSFNPQITAWNEVEKALRDLIGEIAFQRKIR